jgi:hypothetical protein
MRVSDVLVRTVCRTLIHFVFNIFPVFIAETSAGFTSRPVQSIPSDSLRLASDSVAASTNQML